MTACKHCRDWLGLRREMNREIDRLLSENEELKQTARDLSLRLAAVYEKLEEGRV